MVPYTPKCRRAKMIHGSWLLAGPKQLRNQFAQDLLFLKNKYGVKDAIQFRDWMICLGSYPVKGRRRNASNL